MIQIGIRVLKAEQLAHGVPKGRRWTRHQFHPFNLGTWEEEKEVCVSHFDAIPLYGLTRHTVHRGGVFRRKPFSRRPTARSLLIDESILSDRRGINTQHFVAELKASSSIFHHAPFLLVSRLGCPRDLRPC